MPQYRAHEALGGLTYVLGRVVSTSARAASGHDLDGYFNAGAISEISRARELLTELETALMEVRAADEAAQRKEAA